MYICAFNVEIILKTSLFDIPNNVIINKTKFFFRTGIGDLTRFWLSCLNPMVLLLLKFDIYVFIT